MCFVASFLIRKGIVNVDINNLIYYLTENEPANISAYSIIPLKKFHVRGYLQPFKHAQWQVSIVTLFYFFFKFNI